jgi:hypothetical protein
LHETLYHLDIAALRARLWIMGRWHADRADSQQ